MEPSREISRQPVPEIWRNRECGKITVISANLWHDWPFYRRLPSRLNDFADMVEAESADILLLQEVARTRSLHSDEWLAKRLGMGYVYSRANGHSSIGFEEGVAVLSRFPIGEPNLSQLSNRRNPFVRRFVLGAMLETPCGDLLAFSVHLGLSPRQNAYQQAILRKYVGGFAATLPALVGGDFNASESSPQINQTKREWVDTYRHLHPKGQTHTHVMRWPWGSPAKRHRLDYIFLRPDKSGWKVMETRHLITPGKSHSDHHAVLTRLIPDH